MQRRPLSWRRNTQLPGCWLLAIATAMLAATARAEDAEFAKLDFQLKLRSDITWSKVFRGEIPLEENKDKLEAFFKNYVLAEMTDPDKVSQYPTLRKTFHSRYVRPAAQTPAALGWLNDFTLKELSKVVGSKVGGKYYHPSARYNAVLLIGELDQKLPGGVGADNNRSVPYAPALDTLLKCYGVKSMPEAIRAGALSGIVRHASLNVPSNMREKLTDVMVQLVAEKTPPGGRDPQVHDWLRQRAAETLGGLGEAGTNNRVAVPLAATVADAKSSPTLRCAAANALARLKYANDENLDSAAMAKQMGDLAVRLCELHALQVDENRLDSTRRELAQQLVYLQNGVQAPLTLAKFSKTDNAKMNALAQELDGAVSMVDGFSGDDASLKRNLTKFSTELRRIVGPPAGETNTAPTEKAKPSKKPEITAPEIEVDSN